MNLYGTSLYLINIGSQVTSNFDIITDVKTQVLLSKILSKGLKINFNSKIEETDYLPAFRDILSKIFIELNSDYPQFEKLIKCFFNHIYVVTDFEAKFNAPVMFKLKDRIYFEIGYESSYPIEILSIIKEEDCPYLFEQIRTQYYGIGGCVKKYLFVNPDNSEYLLIPEFPNKLKFEIYTLYDLLIMTFGTMEFSHFEEEEAEEVFNYLLRVRDFFGSIVEQKI